MNAFLTELIETTEHTDRGLVAGPPDGLRRMAWREIHREARRVAGGLRALGVARGDAVAVLAGAPRDIAPVVQGIWLAGGSVTMLHQPTPRSDLAVWEQDTNRALRVVDARLLVVGAPFEAAASMGLTVPMADARALRDGPDSDPVATKDSDAAFLQFTSGSTGRPKAIEITYANMHANLRAIVAVAGVDGTRDVMISWLPLFHDMGMMGFLALPMFTGADLVCVTPADFLKDPLLWAQLVTEYRGTMSAAPNFAYSVLARRLIRAGDGAYDLSSLRFVLSGAEPVDAEVVDSFVDAGRRFGLAPESMVPAYGMAEATLAVSMVVPGVGFGADRVDATVLQTSRRAASSVAPDAARYARLGRLLPGFEAKVVTASGSVGSCRQVGEIHLRGTSVAARCRTEGGWREALDDAGWLATGDLGYFTEDDELVVCGRTKDMLIVSGRNIYPVDIERAATRATGVRAGNAAAVRVSSGGHGEGFAVLVESQLCADGEQAGRITQEVSRLVFNEIGVPPRLVQVVPVGSLPKTPSGKLRRNEARQLISGG